MLHTFAVTRRTNGRSLGSIQKANAFSEIGEHRIESDFFKELVLTTLLWRWWSLTHCLQC
jgi:hypothetical protein